ncbi:hypothetical protein [Nitrospira sp. BLG_2]|uniref:hypothetical protein n=1 Tax=Nitrospira sp. BLG_2 TaxID=3397507 RepID=UPI003B99034E
MRQKFVIDGRMYYYHDSNWYDEKTQIQIPVIEANKVNALVREYPELLAAIAAEERKEQVERHELRLKDLGVGYRGSGPSTRWSHRWAHCWACHHPLDSAVDPECSVCHWILCRCGACGCGYYGWHAA